MKMLQLCLVLLTASVHQVMALELVNFDPLSTVCNRKYSNYTTNSTYEQNLKSVLLSLSSNTSNTGFATATAGQSPDKVYGLALCRGDVSDADCRNCTSTAASMIRQICPLSKSAIIWRLKCELRYSSDNFMGAVDTNFFYLSNANNASNPTLFNQQLTALLQNLSSDAAANLNSMFASGQVQYAGFQTLYAAVQCTRDLTTANCRSCLSQAVDYVPACCDQRRGSLVFGPTCNIRYEVYPFLLGSTAGQPFPSPSATNTTSSKTKKTSPAVIAVSVVIPLLVLCILVGFLCRRKSKKPLKIPMERDEEIESMKALTFDLASIEAATNNFSEANKLGEGGYGPVYKGKIDGKEVAVKRLSNKSGQGSVEFKNEVRLIAKLQHRNLVKLLGFCVEEQEKILIYEFLPNNSLDRILFDPAKRKGLDWDARLKVIKGTARGLLYLHEDSRLTVIHRDLKPSNVLLDKDMNPKIADFGMAKTCGMDETQGNTNRIGGTYGYMSPEYAIKGHYSVKSDVFSFGVMLLEIVSGRKNNSFKESDVAKDLLSYAWKLSKEHRPLDMVDEALGDSSNRNEILRCIHIGLLCVQDDALDRPTMSSVVLMLSSTSVALPAPHPPAFYTGSRSAAEQTTLSYSTDHPGYSSSTTGITVTELEAR